MKCISLLLPSLKVTGVPFNSINFQKVCLNDELGTDDFARGVVSFFSALQPYKINPDNIMMINLFILKIGNYKISYR